MNNACRNYCMCRLLQLHVTNFEICIKIKLVLAQQNRVFYNSSKPLVGACTYVSICPHNQPIYAILKLRCAKLEIAKLQTNFEVVWPSLCNFGIEQPSLCNFEIVLLKLEMAKLGSPFSRVDVYSNIKRVYIFP